MGYCRKLHWFTHHFLYMSLGTDVEIAAQMSKNQVTLFLCLTEVTSSYEWLLSQLVASAYKSSVV